MDSCKEGSTPWYFKSAREGDADAQFQVGYAYLMGVGVDKEPDLAVKFIRKAAEQGSPDAQKQLGVMHINGEAGLPKDLELAEVWFRKAASTHPMVAGALAQ